MRTLVIYKRDNEQFGCIIDHDESFDPLEHPAARDAVEDELSSDKNSVFYVEMPNDTFRPSVFNMNGDECAVSFLELIPPPAEDA
jgi:hypothetical protein